MVKNFIKQYMPHPSKIKDHKYLKMFGDLLHNPNLWHINRYSVATAFSVGLFFAWVPTPFQMVFAAAVAIFIHANIAISVALVWLTNPFTMPPLFYFAYRVGAFILSTPPKAFKFELSWEWLAQLFKGSWQPFLLGCFVMATLSAILGNLAIRGIWRYMTVKNWRARIRLRKNKKEKNKSKH